MDSYNIQLVTIEYTTGLFILAYSTISIYSCRLCVTGISDSLLRQARIGVAVSAVKATTVTYNVVQNFQTIMCAVCKAGR